MVDVGGQDSLQFMRKRRGWMPVDTSIRIRNQQVTRSSPVAGSSFL